MEWGYADFFDPRMRRLLSKPRSARHVAAMKELVLLRTHPSYRLIAPSMSFSETLLDYVASSESREAREGWLDWLERKRGLPYEIQDSPGNDAVRGDLRWEAQRRLFSDTEDRAVSAWGEAASAEWLTRAEPVLQAEGTRWLVVDRQAETALRLQQGRLGENAQLTTWSSASIHRAIVSLALHYMMAALPNVAGMTVPALERVRAEYAESIDNYRALIESRALEVLQLKASSGPNSLANWMADRLDEDFAELRNSINSHRSFSNHLRGEATNFVAMNVGLVPTMMQSGVGAIARVGGIAAPNLGLAVKALLDFHKDRQRFHDASTASPMYWRYQITESALR
jgi:hypothetical protein